MAAEAKPQTLPDDDATLAIGAPADDATVIVGAAPAQKSKSDEPAPAKRPAGNKPKRASGGGFLGPVASDLVARGVLPEREAISLALRARDHGHTFFYAMALDAAL